MFDLLDEMLELIYVADVNTYDLLFMNSVGKELFHVDTLKGQKCYRVLQGLDAPCPFCTNALLKETETYHWSFTNTLTGHHYILRDKLLDWKGKAARIEIAVDDTASENERVALKIALDAEKVVLDCAKQLYQTKDICQTIDHVLEQAGGFLGADRAYIFDIRGREMFNTHEWCAQGVHAQLQDLQNIDIALFEGWMSAFNRQECVVWQSLDEVRSHNMESYQMLTSLEIRSLVVAPLEKDGAVVGCIGVDNPCVDKIANISSLFRTLSYFLMSAMRRAEDEEALARLSYYDLLTGFFNRNRFIQDISELDSSAESVGIAYLDINGLKDINDRHGHSYGDRVLFLCARKIAESCGYGEFYRIGGDEFLVICKAASQEEFAALVERMKVEFERDTECHAAIGYQWTEAVEDIQSLISKADAMMYEEKERYYQEHPPTGRYRQWE